MKHITVCECCGEPYEWEDCDGDLGVCGDCNVYDEDLIGIVDFEDER